MSGQGWPRACRTGLLEEEGPRVDSEELTRAEQEGTWGGDGENGGTSVVAR